MQEKEAKFYVKDLKRIETRLRGLEARMIQPRTLETNIRFDLPDGGLRSEGRVLRLRQDTAARLTYKDRSVNEKGVLRRREIEVVVDDFEKTRLFLDALGYRNCFTYEKYRTTYELRRASDIVSHIMLDELPYGNFVEIEGDAIHTIREIAKALNLKWDTAIPTSYHTLFEELRSSLSLKFPDLTFDNFAEVRVMPEYLQVEPSDE